LSERANRNDAGLPSNMAQRAWKDLENLGYDISALMRMNMNDGQVIALRDKAFRYRGLQTSDSDINY
jgi:hypothetical protein